MSSSTLTFNELKEKLKKGMNIEEIAKGFYGHVPYIDDKIMKPRGWYYIELSDGFASIRAESHELEDYEAEKLENKLNSFQTEQFISAELKLKKKKKYIEDLEQALKIYPNKANLHVEIESDILYYRYWQDLRKGVTDKILKKEDYKHLLWIYKKEKEILEEGIKWWCKVDKTKRIESLFI